MPLSWNEIRDRALAFSREWATESSEDAEAKSFWDAFFNVFGVTRRRLASFELPVKQPDGHTGYIDLLWKGRARERTESELFYNLNQPESERQTALDKTIAARKRSGWDICRLQADP